MSDSSPMGGRTWTEQELETVRALYPVEPSWPAMLRALPGRSKAGIRCQVISLGIKRLRNSRTPWTGAERHLLRELYPSAPWPKICAAIPRHPQPSIAKMANSMKLRRDGAERKSKYALIRKLRETRRAQGIQARHLANRIGTHYVQLAKWERGEQMPRLLSFFDWIEALGLRIELMRA